MTRGPGRDGAAARQSVWIVAALVVGAIAYVGVPLELLFGGDIDRSTSYLSENAALDQPHSTVFRVADAIAGSAVALACVLMRSRARGARLPVAAIAAIMSLAVFALGTIADAVFVLRCAPSMSDACRVADAERSLGLAHQIHVVTSVTALAGVTIAASLLSAALWRSRADGHRGLRVGVTAATAAVVITAVVVTAAAIVDQLAGGLPEGAGYVQRAQTVAISAFLCAVAVGVRLGWLTPVPRTSPREVSR